MPADRGQPQSSKIGDSIQQNTFLHRCIGWLSDQDNHALAAHGQFEEAPRPHPVWGVNLIGTACVRETVERLFPCCRQFPPANVCPAQPESRRDVLRCSRSP